ncbi:hemoblobin-interacting domain-containing protein [Candidatus Pristimantibacillus sp. PTI5]|uniref:hemoblobin-interacting domain-containing protein n=1 Tax=Candidatus Pristimantibacillus sp. PTI5 TaxID=3400422 RepID=UPI003B01ED35
MLRKNNESKARMKRTVSQWMAVALTAATVLSVSPVPGYAAAIEGEVTFTALSVTDTTPPAFTGSISREGDYVYLNFNEYFAINAPEGSSNEQTSAFLKSNISIATDGVHFSPFMEQNSEAYKRRDQQLYLGYDNDMKIILGQNTVIKIAGGTLKDEAGNLNEEMNLQVSPPVIQSAEISSDNHDVVITFNEEVMDNTGTDPSSLKNKISLIRNNETDQKSLVEEDTVSIVSGKLHIHFAEVLKGESNQIVISSSALKDAQGNVYDANIMTPYIKANAGAEDPNPLDSTAPRFKNYVFSNSFHDLALVFDENVQIAPEDMANFKGSVQWYDTTVRNYVKGLPADSVVTVSGNTVNIHFETLVGEVNYFYFYAMNLITDMSGNHLNYSEMETNWVYLNDLSPLHLNGGYFSNNGRFLSLDLRSYYSYNLIDLTMDADGSHLKDRITISTDQGKTFSALSSNDVVFLQGNTIQVILQDGITEGSVQVKIAANTVADEHGYQQNSEINGTVAYNTPEFTGVFLSNTASEFVFEDNAAWRTHVTKIELYDYNENAYRTLTSSEYTLTNGKLVIQKGVFHENYYYRVRVEAEGYSSKYFEGAAMKSSEYFYMTAPAVTKVNGITAKINVLARGYQNDTTGNQSVVFELFNGNTPVSIVAADLQVGTGVYSANFNVSDAAANPNYTVKAYIVSHFSDDPADVGVNLATVKTQSEFDQALINENHNNY